MMNACETTVVCLVDHREALLKEITHGDWKQAALLLSVLQRATQGESSYERHAMPLADGLFGKVTKRWNGSHDVVWTARSFSTRATQKYAWTVVYSDFGFEAAGLISSEWGEPLDDETYQVFKAKFLEEDYFTHWDRLSKVPLTDEQQADLWKVAQAMDACGKRNEKKKEDVVAKFRRADQRLKRAARKAAKAAAGSGKVIPEVGR